MSDGEDVYLAWYKQSQMFKNEEKTNSEALSKHTAGWALEYDLLLKLKRQGVNVVGVYVRDTGDKYITKLDNFFGSNAKSIQARNKAGTLLRCLTIDHFRISLGSTKLK